MYIHSVFFVYRISEAPQVAVVGHQLPEKLQLIIGEAIPHWDMFFLHMLGIKVYIISYYYIF
jgi:hypothetical protein